MTIVEETNVWPGLDDLALILEPYGIEVKDVAIDGLRIGLNHQRLGASSPPLVLMVTIVKRDMHGKHYRDANGELAKTVKTIPLAALPALTPWV